MARYRSFRLQGDCLGMWSYSKRAGCACVASGSRKLLKPMPTSLGQARPALHRPHPGKLIRGDCSEAATVADQYVNSVQLKDWVRKNKDQKYVPSDLLKAWDFEAVSDF